MFIFSLFLLLFLTAFGIDAQSKDEVNAAIIRVREYLRSPRQASADEILWLQNSGKIGAGYDTVAGSPICYTGSCQMEGFRRPVFKLNMTKKPEGACTSKFIPQYVDIDCLPSTQTTANTESISTLNQLKESTKKGIEISASVGVFDNSFSYSYSHETRSMIDTIVQMNSTVYFTRAGVTWVRLLAFEPLLELSDQFRYVIENMPCCNKSNELDQYIKEFVIDYFGLMYVKDILLGGIAQQKIIVSEENRRTLQENGFTTTNQAELKVAAAAIFSASTKLAMTEQYDQTKLNTFTKFTQQSSVVTLGGTPSIQSIEEWSKTVSSNPTIIKFGVSPLLDLVSTKRFPKDTKILSKRNLIQSGQEKYIASSLFCFDNCSQHGTCEPTPYFGLGQCRCYLGWEGTNCSIDVRPLAGLLTSVSSGDTCSTEFALGFYDLGTGGLALSNYSVFRAFKACSLTSKSIPAGPSGTLCGLAYQNLNISCDKFNISSDNCPPGYSKYSWTPVENGPATLWTCRKVNATMTDRPGTLCGFYSTIYPGKEVTCGGYYPSQEKCPAGYTFRKGSISYVQNMIGTLGFCSKD